MATMDSKSSMIMLSEPRQALKRSLDSFSSLKRPRRVLLKLAVQSSMIPLPGYLGSVTVARVVLGRELTVTHGDVVNNREGIWEECVVAGLFRQEPEDALGELSGFNSSFLVFLWEECQ